MQADPSRRRRRRSSRRCSAGDRAAIGELGLERIALALTGLFEGHLAGGVHRAGPRRSWPRPRTRRSAGPLRGNVYQPMLELIDELRAARLHRRVVTGGGTEFVRAVSQDLYGVPPEAVVGTPDRATTTSDDDGRRPVACARSDRLAGAANEGAAKVSQHPDPARPPAAPRRRQLRRRPGDARVGRDRRRTHRWRCWSTTTTRSASSPTSAPPRPSPSPSRSPTSAPGSGWTVVSMARDWETVFPA